MKRLLVLFAASAVAMCLGVVPANASGAFTQTVHMSTLNDAIPAGCTGPASAVHNNPVGNGVMHFIPNGTGDWFTSTFEGQDTLTEGLAGPPDPQGNPTFIPNEAPTIPPPWITRFAFP